MIEISAKENQTNYAHGMELKVGMKILIDDTHLDLCGKEPTTGMILNLTDDGKFACDGLDKPNFFIANVKLIESDDPERKYYSVYLVSDGVNSISEDKISKSTMLAAALIDKAHRKYPVSISYKGKLTPEERKLIEQTCRINTISVYMDGSGLYSIRRYDFKRIEKEIEILGNVELSNAFANLDMTAVVTYWGKYCFVWKVSESDFKKLCDIPDSEWRDEWGWWRYAEGCNITDYPTHTFMVNNQPMIGYYSQDRLNDHIKYWTDDGEMTKEEAKQDFFSKKYKGIRSYLCDEIGASTESNVCAIAVDLAKINHTTLGELFSKYGDD